MSIVRDLFGGGAERDAARAQEQAIDRATDETRRQFDLTRSDLQPTIDRGNAAGEREAELLGLRGADAERTAVDNFMESPGQVFLRERAERALKRNAAAVGGLRGGNVLSALQEQAIGIAAGQLGERKDRLRSVASGGDATNINRAGIGSNISSKIAQLIARRGDVTADGKLASADRQRDTLSRVAGVFI